MTGCPNTLNRVVSDSVKFICSNTPSRSTSNYQQEIINKINTTKTPDLSIDEKIPLSEPETTSDWVAILGVPHTPKNFLEKLSKSDESNL
jgi:hypothetical protein